MHKLSLSMGRDSRDSKESQKGIGQSLLSKNKLQIIVKSALLLMLMEWNAIITNRRIKEI